MPCTAGVWSCPATTGETPSPRSHCTFTAIDDRRAVLFAGKKDRWERKNDVYIIDLHTMVMSLFGKLEHVHNGFVRNTVQLCPQSVPDEVGML